MRYKGSCHCGRIRIEVDGEIESVTECDCSICRMSGYLHWMVDERQVRLSSPEGSVSTYVWGTGVARHLFCSGCGVAPLRRPRSNPGGYSVNVRCLEGVDLDTLPIERFDGRALSLP